jgi:serine/threonine protein kinase/ankyrin repeat protein
MASQEGDLKPLAAGYSVASSFESSIRPSRQQTTTTSASNHILDGIISLSAPLETRTSFQIMLEILRSSGLPKLNTLNRQHLLGQGAQFAVYKETVAFHKYGTFSYEDRAVKQAKFENSLHTQFTLQNRKARAHLNAICLEILALTHPEIGCHSNIVKLLGWGTEQGFYSPLTLVMELATCDLASFLKKKNLSPEFELHFSICVDVAAGLDQLHSCGLIHGDLKPQNVLIFEGSPWPVAKLADFGLSIDDSSMEGAHIHVGGTPGWQAPEVEKGDRLESSLVKFSDVYSYGLIAWSTFFHNGETPPQSKASSRQQLAQCDMERAWGDPPLKDRSELCKLLKQCLGHEPLTRPSNLSRRISGIFDSLGFQLKRDEPLPIPDKIEKSHFDYINSSLNQEYTYEPFSELGIPHSMIKYYPFDQPRYRSWELSPLPDILFNDILATFSDNPKSVSEHDCLSLFLGAMANPNRSYSDPGMMIQLLLEASKRGLNVARSLLPVMHRYYGIDLPEETASNLQDWLKSAVADGSIVARPELERIAHGELYESIRTFQDAGGYNQIYSKYSSYNAEVAEESKLEYGWDMLHYLAAYGTEEEVERYLQSTEHIDINAFTRYNETALYLASVRGSYRIMLKLLLRGSDPSIPCTEYEITCMHWLFSFHEDIQDELVAELIARGADIDAKAKWGLPFLHYPFILPAGSPLHWAVVMSSRKATEILVKKGANVLIRDGSYPYAFDKRVRLLLETGGHDEEDYSIPDKETMGLSPLDISAMKWDYFLFHLLLSEDQKSVNVNSVDEEGFTVLHRLSARPQLRTRLGVTISYAQLKVRVKDSCSRLVDIIEIVKKLGGNLDQLTTLTSIPGHSLEKQPENFTPLMLAAMAGQAEVVNALLSCGSNPNFENDNGVTALHCLTREMHPDIPDCAFETCAQHLIAYGADVNHRVPGYEPLVIRVCFEQKHQLVDILLSNGADPGERRMFGDLVYPTGTSIWALLADAGDHDYDPQYDDTIAVLLQKHVINLKDPDKVRLILEAANSDGCTMLHAFCRYSMSICVNLLLSHGVNANALYRSSSALRRNHDTTMKVYTPLDVATISMENWKDSLFMREGFYAREQFDIRSAKYHEIFEALRGAGGTSLQVLGANSN